MNKSELIWALCEVDEDLLLMAKEDANLNTSKKKRGTRYLRIGICVALIAALFAVTAMAAYEYNWFGFERIFGDKAELVEQEVVSYERTSEITDYRFTLESMLAGRDSIYAVICMEPLTEYGQQNMDLNVPDDIEFYLINQKNSGGLNTELLDNDGFAAHYLAIWTGNEENQVGDTVSFEVYFSGENKGYALFSQKIAEIVDGEAVIELDTSIYDTKLEYFDKLTITPLSMTIEGWFNYSYSDELTDAALAGGKTKEDVDIRPYMEKTPKVLITLKDGTTFSLKDGTTDTEFTTYGMYGSLNVTGRGNTDTGRVVRSWAFSQVVDLNEIDHITVNGVNYTLD